MKKTKEKIKVAIADFSPLIIDEGGKYKGFEIDLWEAVAKEAKMNFEYEKHDFKEIVPLLADKKVDVGLAGITITGDRERVIDFSHATLDSGLLISVNRNRNRLNILKTVKNIFGEGRKIITSAALTVLSFIFIFGNLLWFAEKSAKTFSSHYFPGIFESAWLVICSMSTDSFGDYVPHTWLGRIITTGIIIGGVAIFGLFIAQVTAFLAVKKIKGEINNSRDLAGEKVATLEGSTSEKILKNVGAKIMGVANISQAYQDLEDEKIDAVVFDAPSAIYYEKNDESKKIETVGEIFEKQQYGIALRQGSTLREKINQAILKLKESGQYDIFYKNWFGEDSAMES